ncbi:MAG: hypothetical protein QOC94_2236, partial [Actinoplanes sp.]|nr:hypothetical protein [Actinoplanes sp.]
MAPIRRGVHCAMANIAHRKLP